MSEWKTTQLAQANSSVDEKGAARKLPRAFWGLLLVTVLLRSAGIDRPLVGNFATKSVAYAMIARNWVTGNAPLELPTLDCLAGGDRGWHLLDFPVAAYLAGLGWGTFGGNLDIWGRVLAITFSTASVALLFLLVRRWHGEIAAWGAGVALALSPTSIIYGQSFMLEPSMVFLTLATLGSFEQALATKRRIWLILGGISFALVLLTKIYMLVLILPIAELVRVWSVNSTPSTKVSRLRLQALWPLAVMVLAVVPAALWYTYVWRISAAHSELADRVIYSNHHSAANHPFPSPLLWTAGFYGRLLYNLAGPALTPIALLLAFVGITGVQWRRHVVWLAAMGLLLLALPLKFHEMNYYYLVILPPLCVLAGLGWQQIQERFQPDRFATASVLAVSLAISLRLSIGPAFTTPTEDRSVIVAAQATRELTDATEPVVTMHGSTIDLLYYCNRPGWAIAADQSDLAAKLAAAHRQGARLFVVCNLHELDSNSDAAAILANLPTIATGDDYRIYRLKSPADQRNMISRYRRTAPSESSNR